MRSLLKKFFSVHTALWTISTILYSWSLGVLHLAVYGCRVSVTQDCLTCFDITFYEISLLYQPLSRGHKSWNHRLVQLTGTLKTIQFNNSLQYILTWISIKLDNWKTECIYDISEFTDRFHTISYWIALFWFYPYITIYGL